MRALRPLYVALVAMFLQNSLATLSRIVVPIIAVVAFPEMGVDAGYVGIFTGLFSFGQVTLVLLSGTLIRRYGALGISQIGLLSMLIGLTAAASGQLWAFLLTALFCSFGHAMGTPASSHVLARHSPPLYQPLIFSAKQTAVPFGFIIAGVLVPFLVEAIGWRGTCLSIGLICAAFAVILEPARKGLDDDREPTHRLTTQGIKDHLVFSMRDAALRTQILSQGAFVGLMAAYNTYFVLFFNQRLGYSLAEAGALFALVTLLGLPARVGWGYVASCWMTPNAVLAILGVTMTVAVIVTGFSTEHWPPWVLVVVALTANISVFGWQGVALSEVARLAPHAQVGNITASVICLSNIGQVVVPPIFAAILAMTDNYSLCFTLAALPATAASVLLVAHNRHEARAARNKADPV